MEQFSNDLIENSIDFNNNLLENNYFRTIILLVSGVFIGYVLQPVPKWLNYLFNTSFTLKFLILFITGCVAVYPVNKNNKYIIFWIGLCSVLLLLVFKLARKIDDYIKLGKNHEQEPEPKKIENFKNM